MRKIWYFNFRFLSIVPRNFRCELKKTHSISFQVKLKNQFEQALFQFLKPNNCQIIIMETKA